MITFLFYLLAVLALPLLAKILSEGILTSELSTLIYLTYYVLIHVWLFLKTRVWVGVVCSIVSFIVMMTFLLFMHIGAKDLVLAEISYNGNYRNYPPFSDDITVVMGYQLRIRSCIVPDGQYECIDKSKSYLYKIIFLNLGYQIKEYPNSTMRIREDAKGYYLEGDPEYLVKK